MRSSFFKLSLISAIISAPAMADIKPAQLFVDHMVIQRDTEAPIWGTAEPNEKVSVKASWGANAKTVADKEGKWSVKLQTPKAGGPHSLSLEGNNKIQIKDVLSGDVWLCSGQSNMAWPVSKSLTPQKDIATANYPKIRSFMVERKTALSPQENCEGSWTICSPQTVKNFSATAYYTGREQTFDAEQPL